MTIETDHKLIEEGNDYDLYEGLAMIPSREFFNRLLEKDSIPSNEVHDIIDEFKEKLKGEFEINSIYRIKWERDIHTNHSSGDIIVIEFDFEVEVEKLCEEES